ncbi:MAG TPA: 50S ribosomal protein L30 [Treponemataceae bacterium]|jgi:large subunit ribosomal protein L30|nr:50S ribosomal protein L30 [Treponemataceae bacterium]
MANKIEVKQVRSRNGKKPNQRKTLTALGLRKMNSVRVHDDNPVIRGMIMKVHHLVEVREIKK